MRYPDLVADVHDPGLTGINHRFLHGYPTALEYTRGPPDHDEYLYAKISTMRLHSTPSSHDPRSPAFAPASDVQVLRDRASAILWVKSQIAKHGITYDNLVAKGCFDGNESSQAKQATGPVRYRDATGLAWDGKGALPDWLQRAVNAGQSIEHFEVAPPAEPAGK